MDNSYGIVASSRKVRLWMGDENNRFLQNIGTYVPQCMVSDPRKP
jgi:hypothetical protein